jgi:glycosyltransferase involved in cell wall biosynthesis
VTMHVLYLNPSGKLGGAEASLLNLLRGLRELHPDWRLSLLLGEDGELAINAIALGAEVQVLPLPKALGHAGDHAPQKLFRAALATWRYRSLLHEAIKKIQPDVIHTNGFKMHLLGAWSPRQERKTALVCHLHDYVSSRPIAGRLMAASIGRFTAIVANSASVAADAMKLPVPPERVSWIHNGIDMTRFSSGGPALDLDALGGFPRPQAGVLRVGLLATFARWKGHQTFLRAISLLPENLKVRAYVIGGPIYQTAGSQFTMDELCAEARRLGIERKTCFTGFIKDSPSAIRALDIVVHASTKPEPFGMVIIEAMACGKPVIASRAGGAEEIFEEGVTALGHRPEDAADLASQIETLANDSALRSRLGVQGREAVSRRFQASAMASRFAQTYLRSISEASGGECIPAAAPERAA